MESIGKLITGTEQRDAIHMAVAPITATAMLSPGQHVGVGGDEASPVGIVDPFLTSKVFPGQSFWLFLYPNTITSLNHNWSHSAFAEGTEKDVAPSERWIREFAERVGLGYKDLMGGAAEWIATHDGKWGGQYLCRGGLLEGEYVPDEFWDHYEAVTGSEVPESSKQNFFTCSC